jgi:AraC family transcriptional regulator, L-rhamnose operon transcriptional activator RhaR
MLWKEGRQMFRYESDKMIRKDENINIFKYMASREEPEHTHEFIEIVYIFSGKGRHSVNGTGYEVERGNLLFINFGQTHSFFSTEDMEIANCLVNPEFIDKELIHSENAFEMLMLAAFQDFTLDSGKVTPLLRFIGKDMLGTESVINNMIDEFNDKRTNYRTALKGYLLVLLTRIFREMQKAVPSDIFSQINRITPDILKYIEENCFEKLSLQQLAEKSFFSPSYFSRIFKEFYGRTFREYIAEKRMLEAARLLRESQLTIDEIGSLVGYHERAQFHRAFKKVLGVPPNMLRRGAP